jgi:FixJ family two-component response regulator
VPDRLSPTDLSEISAALAEAAARVTQDGGTAEEAEALGHQLERLEERLGAACAQAAPHRQARIVGQALDLALISVRSLEGALLVRDTAKTYRLDDAEDALAGAIPALRIAAGAYLARACLACLSWREREHADRLVAGDLPWPIPTSWRLN